MLEIELPAALFSSVTPLLLILPVVYYGTSVCRKSRILKSWEEPFQNVKILAPYLQPQHKADWRNTLGLLSMAFICVGVVRGINVGSPLILRQIVDKLSTPDRRQGSFPWEEVTLYILIRYVLANLIYYAEWAITRRMEGQLLDRIAIAVYNKMMSLSADYHDNKNSGAVWLTIRNSGQTVIIFVSSICFKMIPNILDLVLAIISFGSVCGRHLAWAMVLVLVVYVLVLVQMSKLKSGKRESWIQAKQKRDSLASDTIPNWWTVSSFGRFNYEKDRYAAAVHHMRVTDTTYCEGQWLSHNAKHLVLQAGLLLICLLVSHDIWYTAGRSAGDLVMFLHFWNHVTGPVQRVLEWNNKTKEFFIDVEQLLDILRQEITVTNREGAEDFQLKNGSIKFEHVTFSYNGKRQVVVQDVSFDVEGGQTIALVGKTGGGKSTLLKLLMRSYDTSSGSIIVDGQNIKDIRKATLLQHISIVPQTIGVFNASILQNLRYAKLDATLEECEEVSRAVGLHEKIAGSFEKGYDEVVGEKGIKLSGGELQRLAIARVLLQESKIVLFDEAMSSLDSETEFKIQAYLRKWCVGRTVIIVAHRLGTISHADVILAVKDGRIVEQGSQEELLAKKGYYYELWDKQKLA